MKINMFQLSENKSATNMDWKLLSYQKTGDLFVTQHTKIKLLKTLAKKLHDKSPIYTQICTRKITPDFAL